MRCTVDASVFAAGVRREEEHWHCSREFLRQAQLREVEVFCPAIVVPECAAALARATGDPLLAARVVGLIESMPRLRLVAVDAAAARRAADVAIECRVRGADSLYVETAQSESAVLVTWDAEVLRRGASVVRCLTPQQWLDSECGPA